MFWLFVDFNSQPGPVNIENIGGGYTLITTNRAEDASREVKSLQGMISNHQKMRRR